MDKSTFQHPSGYAGDTEILTRAGWKPLAKLDAGDEVAGRWPDGEFEWQTPSTRHRFRYDGEMVEFSNRYVNLLVTPNLGMLIRRPAAYLRKRFTDIGKDWHVQPAGNFLGQAWPEWEIPVTATWKGFGPTEFALPRTERGFRPDLHMPIKVFCDFLGIFLAEGHVSARKLTTGSHHVKIEIAQASYNERLGDVQAILDATGFKWFYGHNKFYTTFARLGWWLKENCGHGGPNKCIPTWVKDLPPDCLEVLLHGMMLGDGSFGPLGQRYYPTSSNRLADDVHEVFIKLGVDSGKHIYHVEKNGVSNWPCHKITEIYQGDGAHRLPPARLIQYHGDIHNVSIPGETICLRRNGRVAWCLTN